MKRKSKHRRPGPTTTFSVSLDPESKQALRALADQQFGGNISALVADFAAQARRRMAAGAFLRKRGIPRLSDAHADRLQREVEQAIATAAEHELALERGRRSVEEWEREQGVLSAEELRNADALLDRLLGSDAEQTRGTKASRRRRR